MAFTPKKIETTYDWYSVTYDEMARDNHWRGPFLAAETLQKFAGRLGLKLDHVLDVGGGTGLVGEFVKANHPEAHITNIDLSIEMLKKARENDRAHGYVQGNAKHMPFFRDNQFAAAMLVGMLNYSDHDDAAAILQETARVVRPGGLIVGTSVMDTHGRVPSYIAHHTHNMRDFMHALNPHYVFHKREEITRIKHDRPIEETVFAALVRAA